MALEFIFLRSRFARRMFLLFFAAALIPVGTLAYLSYSYIDVRLTEQSFERSRQAAKSFGLDVLSRLRLADLELIRVGSLQRPGDEQKFDPEKLESAFLSINRTNQSGALPVTPLEDLVPDSKPALLLSPAFDIYLVRSVAEGEWIYGRFNLQYLFAAKERIQGIGEFCVASLWTRLLSCSDPSTRADLQEYVQRLEFDSGNRQFKWQLTH